MNEANANENTKFWERLNSWIHVVHHMLRRRRAPYGMDEATYMQLHRELLAQVAVPKREVATPGDRLRKAMYDTLSPWVSLESLEKCDKRVLRLLEKEVADFRKKLMPSRYRRSQLVHRVTASVAVLTVIVVVLGMSLTQAGRTAIISGPLENLWEHVTRLRVQLWVGLARTTTNQRLIALAGLMVIVGMFFLRTPKRS